MGRKARFTDSLNGTVLAAKPTPIWDLMFANSDTYDNNIDTPSNHEMYALNHPNAQVLGTILTDVL